MKNGLNFHYLNINYNLLFQILQPTTHEIVNVHRDDWSQIVIYKLIK